MATASIEGLGEFWLASDTVAQAVPGLLSANPSSGVQIETLGQLLHEDQPGVPLGGLGNGPPRRVYGVVANTRVTLEGAWLAGVTEHHGEVGYALRETVKAKIAYVGAHLAGEPLVFRGALASVDLLHEWVELNGFEQSFERDGNRTVAATIRYTPPDALEAQSGGLRVRVIPEWTSPAPRTAERSIRSDTLLHLQWEHEAPIATAFRGSTAVQSLVAIVSNASPRVHQLSMHHESRRADHRVGRPDVFDPVSAIYQPARARHDPPPPPDTKHHNFVLSFVDFGGVEALHRWITMYDQTSGICGALLAHRFVDHVYLENRYLNVSSAVEGMDRLWNSNEVSPEDEWSAQLLRILEAAPRPEDRKLLEEALRHSNEPRLKKRLVRIASEVHDASQELVGNINKWASAAAFVRHRYTHPGTDPNDKFDDDKATYFLAESLYWVGAIALLRHAGVSDEALLGIVRHHSLQFTSRQIQKVMSRWRGDRFRPPAGDTS